MFVRTARGPEAPWFGARLTRVQRRDRITRTIAVGLEFCLLGQEEDQLT
jgi:hypothetical protein